MKAEVVETALALLILTLSYCMWYSLAVQRDAEGFYVIEAAGARVLCFFIFCALQGHFTPLIEICYILNGKATVVHPRALNMVNKIWYWP